MMKVKTNPKIADIMLVDEDPESLRLADLREESKVEREETLLMSSRELIDEVRHDFDRNEEIFRRSVYRKEDDMSPYIFVKSPISSQKSEEASFAVMKRGENGDWKRAVNMRSSNMQTIEQLIK